MTTDRFTADRERIAAAMCKAQPGRWWVADEFHELGNAVRAFEVLCDPRGYTLMRNERRVWWTKNPHNVRFYAPVTGDHAADVCRLVCEVLDREAKEEGHGR